MISLLTVSEGQRQEVRGEISHLEYFLLLFVKAESSSFGTVPRPRCLCVPERFKQGEQRCPDGQTLPILTCPRLTLPAGSSGQVSPAPAPHGACGNGRHRGRRLRARPSRSHSLPGHPPPRAPVASPAAVPEQTEAEHRRDAGRGAGRGVGDFIPPLLPGPGEQ